jgi:(p)ppGpp synthase/HD superfamily hydrolase
MDVNIVDLKISGDDRIQQDTLIIQVNDINHLQEVMRQLKHIPNVLSVNRLMSRTSHDYQNDHLYA